MGYIRVKEGVNYGMMTSGKKDIYTILGRKNQ
jgi:hypothetical protein